MKILVVPADRTEPHGHPRNRGDAFLTDTLVRALRNRRCHVTVADFGCLDRLGEEPRRPTGGMADLLRLASRSDGMIVGGGTLFQDNAPSSVVGGLPRLCMAASVAAQMTGTPFAFFGVGMDEIDRAIPRAMIKLAVRRAGVWLRDRDSCERFARLTGRVAELAGDACLLPAADAVWNPAALRSGAALALNRTEASLLDGDLVTYLREQYGSVRFISMDQEAAGEDGASVPPDVRRLLASGETIGSWRDAAGLIAASQVVIASRMHALYMAALAGVPAIGVGFREKVRSFGIEFGVPVVDTLQESRCLAGRVADAGALNRAAQRADEALDRLLAGLR